MLMTEWHELHTDFHENRLGSCNVLSFMFDGLDYVTCNDELLEILVENLSQDTSLLKATYFLDTSFVYCLTVVGFKPLNT
jgi:hypothetical protein